MNLIDKLRYWLLRNVLRRITGQIDYSIKSGDLVTNGKWTLTTLEVIDVNWALMAVAVRLGPNGGVVVWPVWGLKKVAS